MTAWERDDLMAVIVWNDASRDNGYRCDETWGRINQVARAELAAYDAAHPPKEPRMKLATDHICPRCGGDVPNTEHKGEYPGALSRADNETEVCSACGTDEALRQLAVGDPGQKSEWPIERTYWTDNTEKQVIAELDRQN